MNLPTDRTDRLATPRSDRGNDGPTGCANGRGNHRADDRGNNGVAAPPADFIPFARPSLGVEEEEAVLQVIRSGWLTTGPQTEAFEREFASFCGVRHALAVNSATAGLHLALEALGVGAGDLVATTPYTFTATAEVIRYLGADPVFVDIEPRTFNMDPAALERTLEEQLGRVRAVVPVHIGGLTCDMAAIAAAAGRHGIPILEDAAHAFPVSIGGKFVGAMSEAGVYSFYANKTITTGEGGMVVTGSDAVASRVRVMRHHGIDRQSWSRYTSADASWYYEVIEPGYKYNMGDLAAAIGRVQLRKAWALREARARIAEAYAQGLADCPYLELPHVCPDHAWHLFLLRIVPERLTIGRDLFIRRLAERGVGTSVHYIPLHLMPYYASRYGLQPGDFPRALAAYESVISLPLWPDMKPEQVQRVIAGVRAIGANASR
jgi:dTDP-4-amino-4,6-dideoxygalactose transaminase